MKLKSYTGYAFLIFILLPCLSFTQFCQDFEGSLENIIIDQEKFSISSNPDTLGNNSENVLLFPKPSGDWKAVLFEFKDSIDLSALDRISFKLRTSTLGRVYLKLYHGEKVLYKEWAFGYNFKPNINQWTEIIFPFEVDTNLKLTHLEIFASVNNTLPSDVYIDDLKVYNNLSPNGEPVLITNSINDLLFVSDTLQVNASQSYDEDSIQSFVWLINNDTAYQNQQIIKHVFEEPGIYSLDLILTDNENLSTQMNWVIFVLSENQAISQAFPKSEAFQSEKIELSFKTVETYTNPFDPEEVEINAHITLPNGQNRIVPCFSFQEVLYDNGNWVVQDKTAEWMLRWSSDQIGPHQLFLELRDKNGVHKSQPQVINVGPSDAKGIIRRDSTNRQQLRHQNGDAFFPLGINAAWDNTPNYELLLNNLSNGGANFMRYWHAAFTNQALEWQEGLGRYSAIGAAKQDYLLDRCRENGIYLQMCIFHHGMFSRTVNSNWSGSPYNQNNGGMLAEPEVFFYDEQAKTNVKKLLRYLVARWGYSENLFAWELFNEVQWTGNHPNQSDQWKTAVIDWHEEMSKYLRSIDPFKHLITTSAEDHQLKDMDKRDFLDIIQYHTYPSGSVINDLVQKDISFLKETDNAMVLCGEYGYAGDGDVPLREQQLAIWSSLFSEVPHMIWRWQVHYQKEWSNLFLEPQAYLELEDLLNRENRKSFTFNTINDNSLRQIGFQKDSAYYGMIYDAQLNSSISASRLQSSTLSFGVYDVYSLDIGTNVWEVLNEFELRDRDLGIPVPSFSDGLIVKLVKTGPLLEVIAYAGEDSSIGLGEAYLLDASLSSLPIELDPKIKWEILHRPDSSQFELGVDSTLQLAVQPDFPGTYSFKLDISSKNGQVSTDTIQIFVSANPIAIAGEDQVISLGDRADLNGRASYDPENDRLSYQWELINSPAGSQADFRFTSSSRPIFVPDTLGIYEITLTVNDGWSDSSPDTIRIEVVDPTVVSTEWIPSSEFEIYPNPTTGPFFIKLPETIRLKQLTLHDSKGIELWRHNKIEVANLSVNIEAPLSRGVYWLKGITQSGKYFSTPIIILR